MPQKKTGMKNEHKTLSFHMLEYQRKQRIFFFFSKLCIRVHLNPDMTQTEASPCWEQSPQTQTEQRGICSSVRGMFKTLPLHMSMAQLKRASSSDQESVVHLYLRIRTTFLKTSHFHPNSHHHTCGISVMSQANNNPNNALLWGGCGLI